MMETQYHCILLFMLCLFTCCQILWYVSPVSAIPDGKMVKGADGRYPGKKEF